MIKKKKLKMNRDKISFQINLSHLGGLPNVKSRHDMIAYLIMVKSLNNKK